MEDLSQLVPLDASDLENGVLQHVVSDVDANFNSTLLPLDHTFLFTSIYDLKEVQMWLCTGIGIELTTLEILLPGVSSDLFVLDLQEPALVLPGTRNKLVMDMEGSQERRFDCPVYVAEVRHGLPRTCNNIKKKTMSEIRRHLKQRPGRGYAPQTDFLELCPTCNEDFLDRTTFEKDHGYRGEHCTNPQKGRRGSDAKIQWEALYQQLEVMVLSRPTLQSSVEPPSPRTEPDSTRSPVPSTVDVVSVSQSTGTEPYTHIPNDTRFFHTPYELIFDSSSDDGLEGLDDQNDSQIVPNVAQQDFREIPSHGAPQSHNLGDAHTDSSDRWFPYLHMTTTPQEFRPYVGMSSSNHHEPWSPVNMRAPLQTATLVPTILSPVFEADKRCISSRQSERTVVTAMSAERFVLRPQGSVLSSTADSEPCPRPVPLAPGAITISDSTSTVSVNTASPASPISYTNTSSINPLYCSECGAKFIGRYSKGNLGRHKRHFHKYEDAVKYTCEVCGREFRRQDSRLKHYRKHHPELSAPVARPRPPKPGCSFDSNSTMDDQMCMTGDEAC